MHSNETIAQISLEPETFKVKQITLYKNKLRFGCKRCASFCCKLGGPKLSTSDIERLKQAGFNEAQFLDTMHNSLKNTPDGSCFLLQLNKRKALYECSVYDSRPALCRLYPFFLEKMGTNLFILKIMPCRGISRRTGKPVNERFVVNHLLSALNDFLYAKFINAV